jgi:hypothetical protein
MRQVKGVLFADYVRMLRIQKSVDWAQYLPPEDLPYLKTQVILDEWYPMATFERLGNQILRTLAHGDIEAVRQWGRLSADQLRALHPMLVAPRDPVETLNRFRVLRATFFDFEAITVLMLHDDEAQVVIAYGMGMPAEEAAAFQTMGFFERQLELAGASDVRGRFLERSWAGDARTLLDLKWRMKPA